MDWNLEVVTIPVSDVDRAKAFYADKVGFVVDLDTRIGDGSRLVQLTPPGSACSIHLNTGIVDVEPGSARALHLVVSDVEAARTGLVERGVDASEVRYFDSSAIPTAMAGLCRSTPPVANKAHRSGSGLLLRPGPSSCHLLAQMS